MERRLGGVAQLSGVDVKKYLPVVSLRERRVILVAQTVVQSQVRSDLPFVLGIGDVVLLIGDRLTGRAVEERRGRGQISEELHGGGRVRQKVLDARIRIGDAALPVSVKANP